MNTGTFFYKTCVDFHAQWVSKNTQFLISIPLYVYLVNARDPVGTYSAFVTSLIMWTFAAYFDDFPRLFCGLSSLILGTFAAYYVDFPRLF